MFVQFVDKGQKAAQSGGHVLYIIQLLTIEAVAMMLYRPESTNIDRGGAKVSIGFLRLISHHAECLNSQ